MKTLGAAIIIKNEAKNIQRCIHSIEHICQQIVIVDTGSEDSSPIIATQNGADIYFHLWKNDFSEARNFAIRHLRTD